MSPNMQMSSIQCQQNQKRNFLMTVYLQDAYVFFYHHADSMRTHQRSAYREILGHNSKFAP